MVQADIDVAGILATLIGAEAGIWAIGPDGKGLMDRLVDLRKRLPVTAQLKKHTLAPWAIKEPSLEKDGEDKDSVVDYYKRVNVRVDEIKERRRKERERVAAMSTEEREEYEFNKQAEASMYRIH